MPKLTLTLLAVNPFNAYTGQELYMESAHFRSWDNTRYYLREFKLTLNWEFGSQLGSRDRKKISNDDVKDAGKG